MKKNKNSNKVFFIAEAGVNHNGNLNTVYKMIEAAKFAGADCVKFQAFDINKLASKDAKTASYQSKVTGKNSQEQLLKKLTINKKNFVKIYKKCFLTNIEFMCTPFDTDWLSFLISLGMKKVKIPSGEINNFPLLKQISLSKLPIFLSTGMSTLTEIQKALNYIKKFNNNIDLTVLHCTSLYPAEIETLNLKALISIKKKFKVKIGYSDHSIGNLASIASVALGSRVIEKHFTLDKKMYGPDHKSSSSIRDLKKLIFEIRKLEIALGDGIKKPHKKEYETLNVVRRSWHASKDIKMNSNLSSNDIILLRPGTGLSGNITIEGLKTKQSIKKGSLIKKEWLENEK